MADLLSDEEILSVNRAILTRYGIDFTNYEPNSYKRRVARVIDKFKLESSIGLWRELINNKDFIHIFIDEITVGLTEMFRNHDFWIKLKTEIFPNFHSTDSLSIWHAGCSTGEEVYSMAILLKEDNLLSKTNIVATDLNSNSVKNSSSGIFSSHYLETYSNNYISAKGKHKFDIYYTIEGENMNFSKIKNSKFQFQQHNLSKDPMDKKFDLILCRNVMIYFDDTLRMKVLKLFHDCLKDGGFFVIGYYDSMPKDYRSLFTIHDPQIKTYRKV